MEVYIYIYIYIYVILINNSHTKEISAKTEVVYVIQNPPDLRKLSVRFSQSKSLRFSMNMNVYMHSDDMLFTTFASVLYRIYNLPPSTDTTRPLML